MKFAYTSTKGLIYALVAYQGICAPIVDLANRNDGLEDEVSLEKRLRLKPLVPILGAGLLGGALIHHIAGKTSTGTGSTGSSPESVIPPATDPLKGSEEEQAPKPVENVEPAPDLDLSEMHSIYQKHIPLANTTDTTVDFTAASSVAVP